MKALVKAKREPGIWLEEVARPSYGDEDVLIKVRKTAICGTDIHIMAWDAWAQATIPTPMVIGHEFCGEVVAVGKGVKNLSIGQRVSGEGHITCGTCRNCRAGHRHLCRNTQGVGVNRPGCFAEYISLPASNVLALPANISDDLAAILDPLGNAAHCALAFDVVGEDVLITGAGPIGLMAAAISRHIGARHVVITDVNPYRLELAQRMGDALAVHAQFQTLPEVITELGMTEGFDVGLEMSGQPVALNDMLKAMNFGGHIALLGIPSRPAPVEWQDVIFKSLVIQGIYGRKMFETWYKMIAMLQSGLDIASVITHQFSALDYQQAFDVMASGQSGKVVLDWSSV